MKTISRTYLLLLSAMMFILLGCYKDKAAAPECATTVSYKLDIDPIINQSCATGLGPFTGCHDNWILTYDGLTNSINSGSFQSTVFDLKSMPKIPNDFDIVPLTEDELTTIRCWIEQGYPDN